MKIKSRLVKPFARMVAHQIAGWSKTAVADQEKIRQQLIHQAKNTDFGKDHGFSKIVSYEDYKNNIPINDYEGMRSYFDRIKNGESDILWPGLPRYFAKTSGTTSGAKYIPLTKESMPNHFGTARNALFNYYARSGHGDWLDGKMIFLSGSPELTETGGIKTGRLSGIVNHEIPGWLRTSQLPSYSTNCIDSWEKKLGKIVDETLTQDMRLISGIPPWVQMYYEQLLDRSGKKHIKNIFPNYNIFVYGGINFEPYRDVLENLVGERIDSLETYPASEGFIAFQDDQNEKGLLLNTRSGIFFEFIPASEIFNKNPTRLSLEDIEIGVNYAIILNTNAGLWGYNIGDTVKFVSKNPYRILVTGRIKHFISAFGEHVIGKEVESAILAASSDLEVRFSEFTVAPQITPPEGGLPYHEWLIEFEKPPVDLISFAEKIDYFMCKQNIYYQDLIAGKVLQPLKITALPKGSFRKLMKTRGKLGGQNKPPRLSNDRGMAEQLKAY